MNEGETFGEQALYAKATRQFSIRAADDEVICLALSRDTLTQILGDKIQLIIYRNYIKWAFDTSKTLKELTKLQREKLIEYMSINQYNANQVLVNANEPCSKLICVLDGRLSTV